MQRSTQDRAAVRTREIETADVPADGARALMQLGARVVEYRCACGARFRTADELYDHCEEEQSA